MRTTITLNDTIYRALKVHCAETSQNISAFVDNAVKHWLSGDQDELSQRMAEPSLSFDSLVEKLDAEGLI